MTRGLAAAGLTLWMSGACAAASSSVFLEELTWTELRERIAAGATTALLPLGGTEQNGPHMALGKHNVRVRVLAERIAKELGNAVVAPVLAYVPEGRIEPPTEHMRWPGTISVAEPAFEAVIDGAARSLRQAGFCHVVLLGDSGNYRPSLDRVAARVNAAWSKSSACRVHALPEYYTAASSGFSQALQARGLTAAEIGRHAGAADTSLMLATDASLVRTELAAARKVQGQGQDGVSGNPARGSAELGRIGTEQIVRATVAAVRVATQTKQ